MGALRICSHRWGKTETEVKPATNGEEFILALCIENVYILEEYMIEELKPAYDCNPF